MTATKELDPDWIDVVARDLYEDLVIKGVWDHLPESTKGLWRTVAEASARSVIENWNWDEHE